MYPNNYTHMIYNIIKIEKNHMPSNRNIDKKKL